MSLRPDISSPSSRITLATPSSCVPSRSKTGLACGWSPCRGWSPVISSMFGMPSAEAASSSDWSAIRFRSRQVSCMIGSTPASSAARQPAQPAIRAVAPALSVMFTACTQSRSSAALRVTGSVLAPRGGLTSAVTANSPAARTRASMPGPEPWPPGLPAMGRSLSRPPVAVRSVPVRSVPVRSAPPARGH